MDFISTLWGETVWAGKDLVDRDEIRKMAEHSRAEEVVAAVLEGLLSSEGTEGEDAAAIDQDDSEESVPGEALPAALEAYDRKRESGTDE